MCSSTRGPAREPSFVMCPAMSTGTLRCLAHRSRRRPHSRTCTTLPGPEGRPGCRESGSSPLSPGWAGSPPTGQDLFHGRFREQEYPVPRQVPAFGSVGGSGGLIPPRWRRLPIRRTPPGSGRSAATSSTSQPRARPPAGHGPRHDPPPKTRLISAEGRGMRGSPPVRSRDNSCSGSGPTSRREAIQDGLEGRSGARIVSSRGWAEPASRSRAKPPSSAGFRSRSPGKGRLFALLSGGA